MKRTRSIIFILLVLVFSVVTSASAETINLSGLTFDALVALRKQIDLAIMQSDEWKEVTIPAGTYIVGTDIPAGDYTITYNGHVQSILYIYSANGKSDGTHLLGDIWENYSIGKLSLSDGQAIKIEYGAVVFRPYTGFGF